MNAPRRLSDADEIEIVAPVSLTQEQEALVDLHSLLNLLAVLVTSLELLDLEVGGVLGPTRTRVCQGFETIRAQASRGEPIVLDTSLVHAVEAGLDSLQEPDPPPAPEAAAEIAELTGTIRSLLEVYQVRAQELMARSGRFHEWVRYDIAELSASIQRVLTVIEQNARGRYRIVRNIAQQSPVDYQVQVEITSETGHSLLMPPVLQDVLRDLVANSRKYTAPGGRVLAGLHASKWGIRIVVEDDGIGIPREELEHVTRYGYRASNALHRRTMGGGFGLTKAHWVVRQFGGRLWLRSRTDVGTRVTILIPAPAAKDGQTGS